MFTTHIPKQFWGEAVLTATYLINRMPSRVLNFQTPCQTLLQSYPTTQIISSLPLKVFGSTTFVHIHSQNRSKLDPRAIKCVFLGYSTTKKGYKCYSPNTRKFYTSMDVTFFENQPYYKKTNSIQGESSQEECNFWHETSNLSTPKITSINSPEITFISPPEIASISPLTNDNPTNLLEPEIFTFAIWIV